MIFALAPSAVIAAVAFYGTSFGQLVPTSEALESTAIWTPITVVVAAGLTLLIALSCTAPIIRDLIPDFVLAVGATVLAALVTWVAAPGFVAYGLPALKADGSGRIAGTHIVEVIHTQPVCGYYRGIKLDRYGAVVRSEVLGGSSGSKICRIPPSVWVGLRPGDRLTLHGYLGSSAFHYDRITR